MKLSDLQQLAQAFPPNFNPQDIQQRNDYLLRFGLEPGQLYQELEMDSEYADSHQDISYGYTHVELHSHRFCEILCCRSTCGAEYLIGTERYRLQKGDILFVTPGTSHRPLLPYEMTIPYIRDVLWVSESMMHLLGDCPGLQSSGLLRTAGTRWEYLGDLLRQTVEESQNKQPGWQLAVRGITILFLTHLSRAVASIRSSPVAAEAPDLAKQIMVYVEQNLSEKITLEQVSRQLFVSTSTITQTFRKKMGVSFYRYVTQRRLIAAKLLIEKALPLEEVAAKTGFADYSGFYRAFKQEYGISPRQYRTLQDTNS